MQRFPRTATNIIAAAHRGGVADRARCWANRTGLLMRLGFIPARFSLPSTPFPAVPAFLTPLTATLVHGGLIHLGFNLLIFVWCGRQVERVLGAVGLVVLYVVGAYAAAAAQFVVEPACDRADDRRERGNQRGDRRLCAELRTSQGRSPAICG